MNLKKTKISNIEEVIYNGQRLTDYINNRIINLNLTNKKHYNYIPIEHRDNIIDVAKYLANEANLNLSEEYFETLTGKLQDQYHIRQDKNSNNITKAPSGCERIVLEGVERENDKSKLIELLSSNNEEDLYGIINIIIRWQNNEIALTSFCSVIYNNLKDENEDLWNSTYNFSRYLANIKKGQLINEDTLSELNKRIFYTVTILKIQQLKEFAVKYFISERSYTKEGEYLADSPYNVGIKIIPYSLFDKYEKYFKENSKYGEISIS